MPGEPPPTGPLPVTAPNTLCRIPGPNGPQNGTRYPKKLSSLQRRSTAFCREVVLSTNSPLSTINHQLIRLFILLLYSALKVAKALPDAIVEFGLFVAMLNAGDVKPEMYEKFVPRADWFELWAGRDPDHRAMNELRNLKRQGIAATYERMNASCALVTAEATTEKQAAYLQKRGYLLVRKRKTRLASKIKRKYPDVVQTILARPRNGAGGGIPLTRGEVAMLFLDGHAGDGLLDIRSQGYGEDNDWDGLTHDDIFSCDEGTDAAFVWTKWEPLELWS